MIKRMKIKKIKVGVITQNPYSTLKNKLQRIDSIDITIKAINLTRIGGRIEIIIMLKLTMMLKIRMKKDIGIMIEVRQK